MLFASAFPGGVLGNTTVYPFLKRFLDLTLATRKEKSFGKIHKL
jgi:hypothetical protein